MAKFIYTAGSYGLLPTGRWVNVEAYTKGSTGAAMSPSGLELENLQASYMDYAHPNLAPPTGIDPSTGYALYQGKLYYAKDGQANLNRPVPTDINPSIYQSATLRAQGVSQAQIDATRAAAEKAAAAERSSAYESAKAMGVTTTPELTKLGISETRGAQILTTPAPTAGYETSGFQPTPVYDVVREETIIKPPIDYKQVLASTPAGPQFPTPEAPKIVLTDVTGAKVMRTYEPETGGYSQKTLEPPKGTETKLWVGKTFLATAASKAAVGKEAEAADVYSLMKSYGLPEATVREYLLPKIGTEGTGGASYQTLRAKQIEEVEAKMVPTTNVPELGGVLELTKIEKAKVSTTSEPPYRPDVFGPAPLGTLTPEQYSLVYGPSVQHETKEEYEKRIGIRSFEVPVNVLDVSTGEKTTEYETLTYILPKVEPPPPPAYKEIIIGKPAPPSKLMTSKGAVEIPGNLKAFVSTSQEPLSYEFNREIDRQTAVWQNLNYERNVKQFGEYPGAFISLHQEAGMFVGTSIAKAGLGLGVALPAAVKIVEVRGKQLFGQPVSVEEEFALQPLGREVLAGTMAPVGEVAKFYVIGKIVSGAGAVGKAGAGLLVKLPIISTIAKPVIAGGTKYGVQLFGEEYGKYAGESVIVLSSAVVSGFQQTDEGELKFIPARAVAGGLVATEAIWLGKELPKIGSRLITKYFGPEYDIFTYKTEIIRPEDYQSRVKMGLTTEKEMYENMANVQKEANIAFQRAGEARGLATSYQRAYSSAVGKYAPFGAGGEYQSVGFGGEAEYSKVLAKLGTMEGGPAIAAKLTNENVARQSGWSFINKGETAELLKQSGQYAKQAAAYQARFELLSTPTDPTASRAVAEARRVAEITKMMQEGLLNPENIGKPAQSLLQAQTAVRSTLQVALAPSLLQAPAFMAPSAGQTVMTPTAAETISAPILTRPPVMISAPQATTAYSKTLIESAKVELAKPIKAYKAPATTAKPAAAKAQVIDIAYAPLGTISLKGAAQAEKAMEATREEYFTGKLSLSSYQAAQAQLEEQRPISVFSKAAITAQEKAFSQAVAKASAQTSARTQATAQTQAVAKASAQTSARTQATAQTQARTQAQTRAQVQTRVQTQVQAQLTAQAQLQLRTQIIHPPVFKLKMPQLMLAKQAKPSFKMPKFIGKVSGKRTLYSDLISVMASQVKYGKATSPSLIKRKGIWEKYGKNVFGYLPTAEQMDEIAKRGIK